MLLYKKIKFNKSLYIVTVNNQIKLSKGKYYHFNILYFGFGKNGFGVALLGILFTISKQ